MSIVEGLALLTSDANTTLTRCREIALFGESGGKTSLDWFAPVTVFAGRSPFWRGQAPLRHLFENMDGLRRPHRPARARALTNGSNIS